MKTNKERDKFISFISMVQNRLAVKEIFLLGSWGLLFSRFSTQVMYILCSKEFRQRYGMLMGLVITKLQMDCVLVFNWERISWIWKIFLPSTASLGLTL